MNRRLPLWLPVFFAIGIAIYFRLDYEPEWNLLFLYFASCLSLIIICKLVGYKQKLLYHISYYKYYIVILWGLIFLLTAIAGAITAKYRVLSLNHNILSEETSAIISLETEKIEIINRNNANIAKDQAKQISNIASKDYQIRITGKVITWHQYNSKKPLTPPDKIRINIPKELISAYLQKKYPITLKDLTYEEQIKTIQKYLYQNSIIKTETYLYPPPKPQIHNSFDYSFTAWFQQIGAVGKAGDIIAINTNNRKKASKDFISNILYKAHAEIDYLRAKLADKIRDNISAPYNAVAIALITGIRGEINPDVQSDIRQTGIAHLLAISGLHLGLAMAIFFTTSRGILALFPYITLHYNTKKIAICIALIGSFSYLLIAGMPVSAIRSWLMLACASVAILLSRNSSPLYGLFWAGWIILIITPESLMMVSFQMSFAATISLAAMWEWREYKKASQRLHQQGYLLPRSWPHNIFRYLFAVLIASLITDIALFPYIQYHFQHINTLGLITNLIAIPVTSFLVMPAAIIAIFLIPIQLDFIGFWLMEQGLRIIFWAMEFVLSFPGEYITTSASDEIVIALWSIAILWFVICRNNFRLFGLFLAALSIMLLWQSDKADIIISDNHKQVGLYGLAWQESNNPSKKQPYFDIIYGYKNSFVANIWSEQYGNLPTLDKIEPTTNPKPRLKCNFAFCHINWQSASNSDLTAKIIWLHYKQNLSNISHKLSNICSNNNHSQHIIIFDRVARAKLESERLYQICPEARNIISKKQLQPYNGYIAIYINKNQNNNLDIDLRDRAYHYGNRIWHGFE